MTKVFTVHCFRSIVRTPNIVCSLIPAHTQIHRNVSRQYHLKYSKSDHHTAVFDILNTKLTLCMTELKSWATCRFNKYIHTSIFSCLRTACSWSMGRLASHCSPTRQSSSPRSISVNTSSHFMFDNERQICTHFSANPRHLLLDIRYIWIRHYE